MTGLDVRGEGGAPRWGARRWAAAWCAAAVLVGVGALLSPRPVALYDGVGLPDEPYRYVSAPAASVRTPPATSAVVQLPVSKGLNSTSTGLATAESGPQARLDIADGTLTAAAGPITARLDPVAPTDQPAASTIDGNVYQVSFTAPGGAPVGLSAGSLALIYLRATTARQPGPVMQERASAGTPWSPLQTTRAGNDIYVARLSAAGQYALAFSSASLTPTAVRSRGSGGGLSSSVVVVVLAAVVLTLAVAVLAIRRRAARVDA